jgi:3-hydroxy-9,10-secoandrosta-1,3,5(10)-triene-9,17-dione monooxygenase
MSDVAAATVTKSVLLERVDELLPAFRDRAQAGEDARAIPRESVDEMLAAGLAQILVPAQFGGFELGLDTWFEATRRIATVDPSHAWCASLMANNAHWLAKFPLEAQEAVWADGSDVSITVSQMPTCKVTAVEGGYRISGKSPFTSGVLHSDWAMLGGFLPDADKPEMALFLAPASSYEVVDNWHTIAMRGTGSNLVVTEDVFVPEAYVLTLNDLVEGTGPGGDVHAGPIYRMPLVMFSGLTFTTPILGAAQGALEEFRQQTMKRKAFGGAPAGENPMLQIRMGTAAADIDAAELLLLRALELASADERPPIELRARAQRDFVRAAEMMVGAINEIMAMSGTSGFATSNPIQRAWRDATFASRHVTLNPDVNGGHWSKTQLEIPRDPSVAIF